MSATHDDTTDASTTIDDLYLPAVSVPTSFDRIEAFLQKHFSLHGVVLIPDTYGR